MDKTLELTCVAFDNTTHTIGGDSSIDDLDTNCIHYIKTANDFVCVRCKQGFTGFGDDGHLTCTQSIPGCSTSKEYYNIPAYHKQFSSCFSCNDANSVILTI